MRIAFFGTPHFAVPTLDALIASGHEVSLVVTQPDRPRGRGNRPTPGPVKTVAVSCGIPVWQPDRLRDEALLERFREAQLDLGVVAAYGKILPQSLLDIPRLGFINVHASLLPRHRGAAPIHRAIIAGDTTTGVTIMRVVKALDAGPMISTVTRAIGPDETSAEVERDLSMLGAKLLIEVVDWMTQGPPPEVNQDETLATYAPRLTKEEGLIDWAQPAVDIHNRVRGLHPWPHACTFNGAQRIVLLRTAVAAGSAPASVTPGRVIDADGDTLRIAAGAGAIDVLELQLEGRRPMPTRAFLAGHRLAATATFGPPPV